LGCSNFCENLMEELSIPLLTISSVREYTQATGRLERVWRCWELAEDQGKRLGKCWEHWKMLGK
jgi:hypothetical protein